MTTLNIRIEEKTKTAANKIFTRLGFTMSSAVRLFLYQVIKEGALPFTLKKYKRPIKLHQNKRLFD